MFESKDTITERVEAIVAACKQLKRGEFFTHEAISAILGLEPRQESWCYFISRLKRRMEDDCGISLWSEHGVGYRLLTKDEQLLDLPRRRLKRAHREIRRAKHSVDSLPDSNLTLHQRRLKLMQLDAMQSSHEHLAAQARYQAALLKPTEGRPKPATLPTMQVAEA